MKKRVSAALGKNFCGIVSLMTVLYLMICITNFYLLDRQIAFKASHGLSEASQMLLSDDEPSKIKKLHRCIIDERRKLVPDDVVQCLLPFLVFSVIQDSDEACVFKVIDSSLRTRPAPVIFLFIKVFRI